MNSACLNNHCLCRPPSAPPPRCHCCHHHQQRQPHDLCTHIYPLQVAVGLWRGHHSVVGVDDGHDVHAQQLLQRAVQVLPLLVIMEIQICHQDLSSTGGRRESRELTEQQGRLKDVTRNKIHMLL